MELAASDRILASVMSLFRALPEHVFVRTADAVRLVTAMSHGFGEVYSNDTHLLAAAPHFGLHGRNLIDPV